MSWQTHAACRGLPTEWWFTPNTTHTNNRRAQQICRTCPVQTQCLNQALHDENGKRYVYGIFGGLTPNQRNQLQHP